MTQINSGKEFILKVTEEDYREGVKKGWTDEDMLSPGEHRFRHVSSDRVCSKRNDKEQIVTEIKEIL
ncbi:MAG: hypothetical protein M3209_04610 [Acidobacteriota bacterium]|nr:hypothetical protein [Acidobacteriota bacterium]